MTIFERQIKKVEQELLALRLRWRQEPQNRQEIEQQAKERAAWLAQIKKSAVFWHKEKTY